MVRPFHRQAKVRPVAEPLSRAMSSVDIILILNGIDTLDKEPSTYSLAACRKKWSGGFSRLKSIESGIDFCASIIFVVRLGFLET